MVRQSIASVKTIARCDSLMQHCQHGFPSRIFAPQQHLVSVKEVYETNVIGDAINFWQIMIHT